MAIVFDIALELFNLCDIVFIRFVQASYIILARSHYTYLLLSLIYIFTLYGDGCSPINILLASLASQDDIYV